MTVEEALADHVSGLRWADVSGPARAAAARLLLDAAAVAVAGLRSTECRRLIDAHRERGGRPECTVVSVRDRLPAPAAAFLNGTLAHWYEWDDAHDRSAVHVGAVVFPALLAAAESAGADAGPDAGERFLTAAVAAFDVACRVGTCLLPHQHRGWMPTGGAGLLGAAAGAARLLGLDRAGVLSAMGLAAAGAGLSRQPLLDRVNGKNVLCGLAARQAVEAAELARAGIAGAPGFLEGPFGLGALFAGGAAPLAAATADLGRRFAVEEVSLKPYPCCRATHPVIDVALDLARAEPGVGDRVRAVRVVAPPAVRDLVGHPFEAAGDLRVAAQFSAPYTVALALRRGRVELPEFEVTAATADPAVVDLARRVVVEAAPAESPGVWWRPLTVTLELEDGRRLEGRSTEVSGSPARPLSEGAHRDKVAAALSAALPPGEVEDLRRAALGVAAAGPAPLAARLRAARPLSSPPGASWPGRTS